MPRSWISANALTHSSRRRWQLPRRSCRSFSPSRHKWGCRPLRADSSTRGRSPGPVTKSPVIATSFASATRHANRRHASSHENVRDCRPADPECGLFAANLTALPVATSTPHSPAGTPNIKKSTKCGYGLVCRSGGPRLRRGVGFATLAGEWLRERAGTRGGLFLWRAAPPLCGDEERPGRHSDLDAELVHWFPCPSPHASPDPALAYCIFKGRRFLVAFND